MGSLWDGHASQHTRFQIVARTDDAPLSFFAGHPRRSDHTGKKIDLGYQDGTGRYVQSAQFDATYIVAAFIPEDDPADHVYFRYPAGHAPEPVAEGTWAVRTPRALILLRPFGGEAAIAPSAPHGKNQAETIEIFQVRGRRVGMVIEVFDREDIPDDLPAWLAAHPAADTGAWADRGAIRYRMRDGRDIEFVFNPDPEGDRHGDRPARVAINGQPLDLDWPWVWGGPLVRLENRILTVSDGRGGFVIDFTGDLPVYRPL